MIIAENAGPLVFNMVQYEGLASSFNASFPNLTYGTAYITLHSFHFSKIVNASYCIGCTTVMHVRMLHHKSLS